VLAGLAGAAVQWIAYLGKPSAGSLIGLALFQVVCGLATCLGEFAKLHYIGHLARRIPDEALGGRADMLKWGLAICYGLLLVLGTIALVGVASAFSAASSGNSQAAPNVAGLGAAAGAGCLIVPVAIVLIVLAIMTIILIYQMGQAVRQQIPLAMQVWSRPPAAIAQPGGTPPPPPPAQNMRPGI
jgi:hypothetical protein